MNDRQALALAAPLARASEDLAHLRQIRRHRTGLLLVSILAVDR